MRKHIKTGFLHMIVGIVSLTSFDFNACKDRGKGYRFQLFLDFFKENYNLFFLLTVK